MLDPLPCKRDEFNRTGEWKPDWRFEIYLNERYSNLGTEWDGMKHWLMCNPSRLKTSGGMKRFVGNWLKKSGQIRIKIPKDILERHQSNPEVSRTWMQKIRSVLKGREPGEGCT